MRTADEIREGRAWVQVYQQRNTIPESSDEWVTWDYYVAMQDHRHSLNGCSPSENFADTEQAALEAGRVLAIPVLYVDTVLYDPPDRLAALQTAGDGLLPFVQAHLEHLTLNKPPAWPAILAETPAIVEKVNDALAAWRKASGA